MAGRRQHGKIIFHRQLPVLQTAATERAVTARLSSTMTMRPEKLALRAAIG
jgi:hypothetical protein